MGTTYSMHDSEQKCVQHFGKKKPEQKRPFGRPTQISDVKVKCTLVQALRLCTGRTAHRGSRGIALPFLDHGTRRGWGISITPRLLLTPGKDLVPIVQEAGWAPGPVWTGAENLAPTGIRSPDRPACSQSLYQLYYPAHKYQRIILKLMFRNMLVGVGASTGFI